MNLTIMKIIDQLKFGDIVLIHYPFADFTAWKKRPALFLSSHDLHGIFIMMSSKIYTLGKYDIMLPKSVENNLVVDSVIKMRKITTIDTNLIHIKLGELSINQKKSCKQSLYSYIDNL